MKLLFFSLESFNTYYSADTRYYEQAQILAYFSLKYGLIIVLVCLRNIHPVQTKSPKTSYWIRRWLLDFIYYQHF